MSGNFADRLLEAIEAKKTPAFVGIDPVYDRLPPAIREDKQLNDAEDVEAAGDAIREYCAKLIRAVAPHVAGVKVNSAFFEPLLGYGIEVLMDVLDEARRYDLITIADVKRGDVGHSAERYAAAYCDDPTFIQLEGMKAADAVTVNGYFGQDGVWPFVQEAVQHGRGVFVLVRTSNPSAASIQDLKLAEGGTVAEHVAKFTGQLAAVEGLTGSRGMSCVGAVVGTQDPAQVAAFRALLPRSIFLVPGYGQQGMTPELLKPYYQQEQVGAIVSSSRGVIFAYEDAAALAAAGGDWVKCVSAAAERFKSEIATVCPL